MKSKSSEGPCRNAGIYKSTVRIHFKPKTKKKKKKPSKNTFLSYVWFHLFTKLFHTVRISKKKKKKSKGKNVISWDWWRCVSVSVAGRVLFFLFIFLQLPVMWPVSFPYLKADDTYMQLKKDLEYLDLKVTFFIFHFLLRLFSFWVHFGRFSVLD